MANFNTLDVNAETFRALKNGNYPWWDNLRKNEDISIQIRKDNTLDVYYRGGAIVGGLRFDGKAFSGEIHSKYIPLADDEKYNKLSLTEKGVELSGKIEPLSFSQFEEKTLKAITDRIKFHFDSKSEKTIQYEIATSHPSVIDTEFASKDDNARIDLVHIDTSNKKLVFVEVKTIVGSDPESIYSQLKKYYDFVASNSAALLDYYKKVLQIKNELEINKLSDLKNLDNYSIEEKPLLLFGDCSQEWIDTRSVSIDEKIKNVAYGVFYYGGTESSLNLNQTKHKNRHIF